MDNKELDNLEYDSTVSCSKEESMMRALELVQASVDGQNGKKLYRPEVKLAKVIILNLVWIAVLIGVYFLLDRLLFGAGARVLLTVLAALLISAVNSARIIITLVRIYQRYAPESLRRACVFEPTCSQYMILAVEKYGAVKGVIKGVKRLSRCHPPNAGEDYP